MHSHGQTLTIQNFVNVILIFEKSDFLKLMAGIQHRFDSLHEPVKNLKVLNNQPYSLSEHNKSIASFKTSYIFLTETFSEVHYMKIKLILHDELR